MTTPTEFVLWLNGAAGVMGEAPTPEQWGVIKEKMNESLGFLAAKKLLERVEEQTNRRVAQFNADIARYQAMVNVHAAKSSLEDIKVMAVKYAEEAK